MEGYFGKVTATVDFCEPNYDTSYYIAEWWNTWTNLVYIITGTLCLIQTFSYPKIYKRNTLAIVTFIIIGIGSFCFHASMVRYAQALDELPMIYAIIMTNAMFLRIKYPNREYQLYIDGAAYAMGTLLTIIYVGLPSLYFIFVFMFAALCIINSILEYKYIHKEYKNSPHYQIIQEFWFESWMIMIAAFVVWCIEFGLCSISTRFHILKLHSVWHFMTSYAATHHMYNLMIFTYTLYGYHVEIDVSNPFRRYILPKLIITKKKE